MVVKKETWKQTLRAGSSAIEFWNELTGHSYIWDKLPEELQQTGTLFDKKDFVFCPYPKEIEFIVYYLCNKTMAKEQLEIENRSKIQTTIQKFQKSYYVSKKGNWNECTNFLQVEVGISNSTIVSGKKNLPW